jgi:hypothetical protein
MISTIASFHGSPSIGSGTDLDREQLSWIKPQQRVAGKYQPPSRQQKRRRFRKLDSEPLCLGFHSCRDDQGNAPKKKLGKRARAFKDQC